jgi:putative transposase
MKMGQRDHTAEQKARAVIELLQGERTLSEIASEEGVTPKTLDNWRKEFLANASRAFTVSRDEREVRKVRQEGEDREKALAEKVGQLTIEVDWLKKNLRKLDYPTRKEMAAADIDMTPTKRCEDLGINRTSVYYRPKGVSMAKAAFDERVMALIDYWHCIHPAAGTRQLSKLIRDQNNIRVGRKLVRRLMEAMGICSMAPRPNTSRANKKHKKFPYLLRGLPIFLPNQVWAVDITYIKMGRNHMFLTAIIDWYSRYIVGWQLSDTLEAAPVLEVIKKVINKYGVPGIINSDQGVQFTSQEYVSLLKEHGIRQSMDGKARWVDNVIIERWFRSLKCEEIYINEYCSPRELRDAIRKYVDLYNNIRPHSSIGDFTPVHVYGNSFPVERGAA